MSVEIRVPVLGESVTSATITRWLKQPGEAVLTDEPIVELETDKISVEVPAPQAGVLLEDLVAAGAEVAVGGVLGTIDPQGKLHKNAAAAPPKSAPAQEKIASSREPMPAAARLMAEKGIKPEAVSLVTGLDGRITKEDVIVHTADRPSTGLPQQGHDPAPKVLSPRSDVAPMSVGASGSASPPRNAKRENREQRVPMTRLRQTIARRLKDAQNTAAILTTFNEVDMSAAKALRTEYRDAFEKKHGVKLGFTSIYARACVEALREFPALNATIEGEDIVYHRFVNLGIAVGSERGLVVPVLHDADEMGLGALECRISDYGSRARAGTLKLDELSGGTFSITNGGVFGSLLSTPILNTPQSAILGMHAILDRPIAVSGEVVIRPMMYVALSYDHRLVDGREAVSFLVRVKQYVEDPRRLLLDV